MLVNSSEDHVPPLVPDGPQDADHVPALRRDAQRHDPQAEDPHRQAHPHQYVDDGQEGPVGPVRLVGECLHRFGVHAVRKQPSLASRASVSARAGSRMSRSTVAPRGAARNGARACSVPNTPVSRPWGGDPATVNVTGPPSPRIVIVSRESRCSQRPATGRGSWPPTRHGRCRTGRRVAPAALAGRRPRSARPGTGDESALGARERVRTRHRPDVAPGREGGGSRDVRLYGERKVYHG